MKATRDTEGAAETRVPAEAETITLAGATDEGGGTSRGDVEDAMLVVVVAALDADPSPVLQGFSVSCRTKPKEAASDLRPYATCLGQNGTHVVGNGLGDNLTPAVSAHEIAGPAPLVFAQLNARIGALVSAGAGGAGIGAGDEGKK